MKKSRGRNIDFNRYLSNMKFYDRLARQESFQELFVDNFDFLSSLKSAFYFIIYWLTLITYFYSPWLFSYWVQGNFFFYKPVLFFSNTTQRFEVNMREEQIILYSMLTFAGLTLAFLVTYMFIF